MRFGFQIGYGPVVNEKVDEKVGLALKIEVTLHSEATPSQRIEILDTVSPSPESNRMPFSL